MPALPYRLLSPPPSSISSLLARLLFGFSHFLTFLTFSIYLGVPDSGSWIPLHFFAFGLKPLFQFLIFTLAIHLGTPDLAAGLFFSFSFSFFVFGLKPLFLFLPCNPLGNINQHQSRSLLWDVPFGAPVSFLVWSCSVFLFFQFLGLLHYD